MIKNKSKSKLILAGDVGGTKTILGLCRPTKGILRIFATQTFNSRSYKSLEQILTEFLNLHKPVLSAASFGVAGPVVCGNVIATNLPWKMSEKALAKHLKIKNVMLINDLVANAYGIETMTSKDFVTINPGKKVCGNAALLSPGTGLGAAFLFWDGTRLIPTPSEGGHVDFGPNNSLERELLVYLSDKFKHVSYERILSGAGLVSIYDFLKDSVKYDSEPQWLSAKMQNEHPAAVITAAARLRKSRLCEKALDVFASICGSAASNLALLVMATSGVYLGGGIAPKIIWKLKDGTFMKAFSEKGRLTHIVKRIPVKVIMNDHAALQGAAVHAMQSLQKK